jgi:hypothetical protein
MHRFITVLICMAAKTVCCQDHSAIIGDQLQLKENTIYIFCRGTVSKAGLISRKFNLMDSNITHIGIGFAEEGKLSIYNVSDNVSVLNSAMVVDSIESYTKSPDVFYFSIWECNNSGKDFNNFKSALSEYASKNVVFDVFFRINADDTLYCSEFCARVLAKANRKKYSFNPSVTILNNVLYQSYLGREKLIYFPVDFFETSRSFKKIFSYRFN